jgi:hypothetical protein
VPGVSYAQDVSRHLLPNAQLPQCPELGVQEDGRGKSTSGEVAGARGGC